MGVRGTTSQRASQVVTRVARGHVGIHSSHRCLKRLLLPETATSALCLPTPAPRSPYVSSEGCFPDSDSGSQGPRFGGSNNLTVNPCVMKHMFVLERFQTLGSPKKDYAGV